jgi:hypothetical protein
VGVAARGASLNELSIIGYETGALRPDGTPSPGRRATFFMNDTSFNDLNATGLRLFDAAVGYVVPEPATFGLLGLAAVGLLARRRHAA